MQNPLDWRNSYGPKQGDLRHRWVTTYSAAIPADSWARQGAAKAIFAGWTLKGLFTWRSGLPINMTAGRDLAGNDRIAGQRPDLVSGADPYRRDSAALTWLNSAAFNWQTPQSEQRFGDLGFNALRGPARFSYDAAPHKMFHLAERHTVTFRFEMFNALNHKILSNPNSNLASPQFGQIQSASGGRNIPFALKYRF